MSYEEKLDTAFEVPKRFVGHSTLQATKESDETYSFRTHLENLITYASQDGFPSRFDFYVTNNKNMNLTGENKVLALLGLPIYPALFNPDPHSPTWAKNRFAFIQQAKTPESIQTAYNKLLPELRETYIAKSADLLMSYILSEIGLRYFIAKEDGDSATMNQLKSLRVLEEEGFDPEMFAWVLKTPGGIITRDQKQYINGEKDGKKVHYLLSPEQAESFKAHQKIRDKGMNDGRFYAFTLSGDLDAYEVYDIKEAKFNQSVGGHLVKKYSQNSTHPTQPGE